MVKDDRHRTRGLVVPDAKDDFTEVPLHESPNLFRLIGTIQEEVHRFVIEYHRGVRGKKLTRSELDDIPGIGEKRRNALLLKFGSVEGIKTADVGDLAQVPGMNRATAETIVEYFRKE